ncbi:hypothetical protein [Oribacterium parvum]|uniref:hypothetical protein n=1 Tax=Oribacterium parvum TaxID=1501329 RepID=UPI0028EF8C22|nr:hypothetical protein [Oribacterium parvum]
MREQAITNMVEGLAELHVEHLKTGVGSSLIAYLSKKESEHKGDWRALAAAEASIFAAVCKKILEELDKDD